MSRLVADREVGPELGEERATAARPRHSGALRWGLLAGLLVGMSRGPD